MKMDLAKLPKIELHLHLDCSLSYQAVRQLCPGTTEAEYRQSFTGPPKCTDLRDFLSCAVNGIELLQSKTALHLATIDLFEQLRADQVIYAEIRFAPLLHTEKGLAPQEVVAVVNQAVEQGIAQTGIQARLILCTLRHYTEDQSMTTIKLVEQFAGTKVVGFDIAGDEAGFPIDAHVKAFQYAKSSLIPCTAHAGEARGAPSVWETLQHFQPSRIGHGVRSLEDMELIDRLKAKSIHLEVCPTSNVQTNIYPEMRDHQLDQIFQRGVSMSINTDARAICGVTLREEYQTLQTVFQWKKAQLLQCNLEAIKHAFIPDELKVELQNRILNAWQ